MLPLQELVKHPTDDTFIISRLQIIQQSTNRLSNLINQFLDLRKIDKEALPLSIQETNIAHLFEAILESFRPLAEQKGINFQYFSDSSEIQGWIDRDKVSKILNNLLSNAIKFTQKGHQITVFIAKEEDHIFFTVEDNGCGISEQDLPHIFDRFYQCGTQQSSGTGIGLSLVYELNTTASRKNISNEHHRSWIQPLMFLFLSLNIITRKKKSTNHIYKKNNNQIFYRKNHLYSFLPPNKSFWS